MNITRTQIHPDRKTVRRGGRVLLGGLAAAAVLAGLVLAPAAANAAPYPASVTADGDALAPQYARGFHIWNLTGHPMKVLTIDGNASYEGRPEAGQILQPGQMHDWEVQFQFFTPMTAKVTYAILGADGRQIGTYGTTMFVQDTTGIPSWTSGVSTGFVKSGRGMDQVVMGADGTVTDPAQQQYMLRSLCESTIATCTFADERHEQLMTPKTQVWEGVHNNTSGTVKQWAEVSSTTSVTNSFGVEVTAGGGILGPIAAEIKARYSVEMTNAQTVTAGLEVTTMPYSTSVVSAVRPIYRDTGTMTIALEGHTWTLPNLSVDSPDPTRRGDWIIDPIPDGSGPAADLRSIVIPMQ